MTRQYADNAIWPFTYRPNFKAGLLGNPGFGSLAFAGTAEEAKDIVGRCAHHGDLEGQFPLFFPIGVELTCRTSEFVHERCSTAKRPCVHSV